MPIRSADDAAPSVHANSAWAAVAPILCALMPILCWVPAVICQKFAATGKSKRFANTLSLERPLQGQIAETSCRILFSINSLLTDCQDKLNCDRDLA